MCPAVSEERDGDKTAAADAATKEVELATGLPRSTIYERMAKGKFPRPVFPDGARAARWVEAEIIDWQAKQIAARDGKSVGRS